MLRVTDRDVLLSPTAWINDVIINAAQALLAQQFPNLAGLQDVVLGVAMMFTSQTGEFLQIINTGHAHWITISSIGEHHPVIRVFDSLYDSIPTMAKVQIASLLQTQSNSIQVEVMDVQKQVSFF